jgi:hypothetical protein
MHPLEKYAGKADAAAQAATAASPRLAALKRYLSVLGGGRGRGARKAQSALNTTPEEIKKGLDRIIAGRKTRVAEGPSGRETASSARTVLLPQRPGDQWGRIAAKEEAGTSAARKKLIGPALAVGGTLTAAALLRRAARRRAMRAAGGGGSKLRRLVSALKRHKKGVAIGTGATGAVVGAEALRRRR